MIPSIEFTSNGKIATVSLKGEWTIRHVATLESQLNILDTSYSFDSLIFDLSCVEECDSSAVFLLEKKNQNLIKKGKKTEFRELDSRWIPLFHEIKKYDVSFSPKHPSQKPVQHIIIEFFEKTGERVLIGIKDLTLAINMLGASFFAYTTSSGRRKNFRVTSCIHHIRNLGINAIPVIALISLTVGAIITQQGAFQMRRWGVEFLVVSLSVKLILRDTGVLLAAIMIAGRSGSAITAELGSMKIREEMDALHVLGLNSFYVLILPRLFALLISLPFLTIISDCAGVIGSTLVGNLYSGLSFDQMMDLLNKHIKMKDILVGLIKSPFMAIAIAIIASMEGMKVRGSAESLGKKVTSSVVRSIFVVIILDGFFTIFFTSIRF